MTRIETLEELPHMLAEMALAVYAQDDEEMDVQDLIAAVEEFEGETIDAITGQNVIADLARRGILRPANGGRKVWQLTDWAKELVEDHLISSALAD